MDKKTLRFRSVLALIWGVLILSSGTFAHADGERGEKFKHDNYRYHHHDGMWYSHNEVVVQKVPNVQINL